MKYTFTFSPFSNLSRGVLDFLLPPLCSNCDQSVMQDQALCATCWKDMTFIAAPYCACCGVPFEYDLGTLTLCSSCLECGPTYAMARSALVYDAACKSMILRFKHADRLHPAQNFAQLMKRAGGDVIGPADVIVPVPLHRWRLFKRRANQAAVLAKALAGLTGTLCVPDLLTRLRPTPPQGHMKPSERAKNVAGAFGVRARNLDFLQGKTVLLVDDVLTTGATVNACAVALLQAGACKVNVLTLARAVKK